MDMQNGNKCSSGMNSVARLELENLRKLRKEKRAIEASLENIKPELVADFYKDYRTGYPVTKSLRGFAIDERAVDNRRRMLFRKCKEVGFAVESAERIIESEPDAEMRAILRLYYVEEMSHEQIAEILDYSRSAISKKMAKYFTAK